MKNPQRVLIGLAVASMLLGCIPKSALQPASQQVASQPAMPPLQALSPKSQPAPVFGPPQEFVGSPLDEAGRAGLFDAHGLNSNRIALLKNGDESFAARVQLLEAARKSIRIQALIFSGDESGLHIAEILKTRNPKVLMCG